MNANHYFSIPHLTFALAVSVHSPLFRGTLYKMCCICRWRTSTAASSATISVSPSVMLLPLGRGKPRWALWPVQVLYPIRTHLRGAKPYFVSAGCSVLSCYDGNPFFPMQQHRINMCSDLHQAARRPTFDKFPRKHDLFAIATHSVSRPRIRSLTW